MGFFDSLKSNLNKAKDALGDEFTKFKNSAVLDAIVGGCTIVAAADGNIDSTEKQKMLGYLRTSPLTKAYPMDQVVKIFNEHSERFDFDVAAGRSEALRIIGKQRNNPDIARMIIRACIIIGGADGDFDDAEKDAVRMIARELGQNPGDFDL